MATVVAAMGLLLAVAVPVGLTLAADLFLLAAARRFLPGSPARAVANATAVLTGLACTLFVANALYEVYRPILTEEKAATNGLILLFGPALMSMDAIIAAVGVGAALMLGSWLQRYRGDR